MEQIDSHLSPGELSEHDQRMAEVNGGDKSPEQESESAKIKEVVNYDIENLDELEEQLAKLSDPERQAFERIRDIKAEGTYSHGSLRRESFPYDPDDVTRDFYNFLHNGLMSGAFMYRTNLAPDDPNIRSGIGDMISPRGEEVWIGDRTKYDIHNYAFPDMDIETGNWTEQGGDFGAYLDASGNHVPNRSGLMKPEGLFMGFEIIVDDSFVDSVKSLKGVVRHRETGFAVRNRIAPRNFDGIIVANPKFSYHCPPLSPDLDAFPAEIKKAVKFNQQLDHKEPVYDDIYKEPKKLGRICQQLGLPNEEYKKIILLGDRLRSDNAAIADSAIGIYGTMMQRLESENRDGVVPLYSYRGDMLWPLKIPYLIVGDYLKTREEQGEQS